MSEKSVYFTNDNKELPNRRVGMPNAKVQSKYKLGLTNEVVAVALYEYLTGLVYNDGARYYLWDYCKQIKNNPGSCIKEGDNFEQMYLRNCQNNPDFTFVTNQKDLLIKVLRAEVRMHSMLAGAYSMQSAFNSSSVVEATRKSKQFIEAKDFVDKNKPFIGMPEGVMKLVEEIRKTCTSSLEQQAKDKGIIATYKGREGTYAIYDNRVEVLYHQYFKGELYNRNDKTMKSVDFIRKAIDSVMNGNQYIKDNYTTPIV